MATRADVATELDRRMRISSIRLGDVMQRKETSISSLALYSHVGFSFCFLWLLLLVLPSANPESPSAFSYAIGYRIDLKIALSAGVAIGIGIAYAIKEKTLPNRCAAVCFALSPLAAIFGNTGYLAFVAATAVGITLGISIIQHFVLLSSTTNTYIKPLLILCIGEVALIAFLLLTVKEQLVIAVTAFIPLVSSVIYLIAARKAPASTEASRRSSNKNYPLPNKARFTAASNWMVIAFMIALIENESAVSWELRYSIVTLGAALLCLVYYVDHRTTHRMTETPVIKLQSLMKLAAFIAFTLLPQPVATVVPCITLSLLIAFRTQSFAAVFAGKSKTTESLSRYFVKANYLNALGGLLGFSIYATAQRFGATAFAPALIVLCIDFFFISLNGTSSSFPLEDEKKESQNRPYDLGEEKPIQQGRFKKGCKQLEETCGLTPRESEIITLYARGLSAEAISGKLLISPATVRSHIKSAYAKANLHSRQELMERINGE